MNKFEYFLKENNWVYSLCFLLSFLVCFILGLVFIFTFNNFEYQKDDEWYFIFDYVISKIIFLSPLSVFIYIMRNCSKHINSNEKNKK